MCLPTTTASANITTSIRTLAPALELLAPGNRVLMVGGIGDAYEWLGFAMSVDLLQLLGLFTASKLAIYGIEIEDSVKLAWERQRLLQNWGLLCREVTIHAIQGDLLTDAKRVVQVCAFDCMYVFDP